MFSTDGQWLLGAATDGLRRWPATAQQLLDLARKVAETHGSGRDLSEYSELLEGR